MKIPVPAIRFQPFSHEPGAHCLLPCSWLSCQLFPAKISITNQSVSKPVAECFLEGWGPTTQFTVIQDLERGHIQASGFCSHGYFRYQLLPGEASDTCFLRFLKVPSSCTLTIQTKEGMRTFVVAAPVDIAISGEPCAKKLSCDYERLFLGCSKAQDWTLVQRRQDIREILPFWHRLAQMLPPLEKCSVGALLPLEEAISQGKNQLLPEILLSFFLSSFTSLLLPQLLEDTYLGYGPTARLPGSSSLHLLQESLPWIRQLFFIELPQHLYVLPVLPPHFHCGMLSGVVTAKGHRLTFEWTKQAIRRLWIEAAAYETITVIFQKHLHRYRLRSDGLCLQGKNFSEVAIRKGSTYLFDQFEK